MVGDEASYLRDEREGMRFEDIVLTEEEIREGLAFSSRLQDECENTRDRVPGVVDYADDLGRLGEIAFSIATELPINRRTGVSKQAGDVGGVEVRTTRYNEVGRLLVRKFDLPDKPFALVTSLTSDPPWRRFRIPGWIVGRDAQRDEWLDDPNGRGEAWWVPQTALRPISELLELRAEWAAR